MEQSTEQLREVLRMIAADAEADVHRFEGLPFTGKTVAEYMGCQAAAIQRLAQIVEQLLPPAARELVLERRDQENKTPHIGRAMLTPPVGEDYWAYRVRVGDGQAIVAFPKFMTIGVGFAKEEDWNTNLPWTTAAKEIFDHISHNKGDDSITDADCVRAIEMIQAAIEQDRAEAPDA
jgi:hypothetical protein